MISIVWATATIVFFLPLRTMRRWYCAARYVFLVREAAQAAWQRARRNQMLPLGVFPDRRLPALSLFPGQIPAHLAAWPAVGNWSMLAPISATKVEAVSSSIPGIVSQSSTRACKGLFSGAAWTSV